MFAYDVVIIDIQIYTFGKNFTIKKNMLVKKNKHARDKVDNKSYPIDIELFNCRYKAVLKN